MSFEVFTETGTRNKEFISITENKTFGLSRAFVEQHKITKEHKAVLLYDPETNQVGLHFSLEDPKIGFSVRIPNERHGASVIARSFFELKAIDAKVFAGRYDDFHKTTLKELGLNKNGEAFVLTLKKKSLPEESIDSTLNSVALKLDDTPINMDDIPF